MQICDKHGIQIIDDVMEYYSRSIVGCDSVDGCPQTADNKSHDLYFNCTFLGKIVSIISFDWDKFLLVKLPTKMWHLRNTTRSG